MPKVTIEKNLVVMATIDKPHNRYQKYKLLKNCAIRTACNNYGMWNKLLCW
ncbi:hypothetical protein AAEX28_01640 [Lentisphaerota bacterium WC36G]|nr:hypothetical protein LJT99_04525 [Lentisphaerae bacterium WC36]